jgi:ATP-dependent RNA helicase DDX19/DBP5
LYSTTFRSWEHPKLKIPPPVLKALIDELEYDMPSKIQACTLPVVTEPPYPNFIAQSQNGSGKTLAFVLSSVIRLDIANKHPQVMVVGPTRELVKQIFGVYTTVTKFMTDVKLTLILPDSALDSMALGHILVGTPSALMKVVRQDKRKFDQLKMLIVDEADMAFEKDGDLGKQIIGIYKQINPKKQTLLFSATFPESVMKAARELVHEASVLKITPKQLTLKGVTQLFMRCEQKKKFESILAVFGKLDNTQTIMFCNTRMFAQKASEYLSRNHFKVGLIIGGMELPERDAAVKSFNEGKYGILISTNLLARGYDNRGVTLVINLDIPRIYGTTDPDIETYLHRVGRTGRFGDIGVALNIIETESDLQAIEQIKQAYSCGIEETTLDNLQKQVKIASKSRKTAEKTKIQTELGPKPTPPPSATTAATTAPTTAPTTATAATTATATAPTKASP